jgi:hypothetical protein
MGKNAVDFVETIRLDPETLERMRRAKPSRQAVRTEKSGYQSGAFAICPLEDCAVAFKAVHALKALVWVVLLHLARVTRSETVTLANGLLAKLGVSRMTKTRALAEFESAGLVAVERAPGRAPRVTILRR